jgi:hypothetical protein
MSRKAAVRHPATRDSRARIAPQRTKKTCKRRPFEAAEGIRTLDLLHGKQ